MKAKKIVGYCRVSTDDQKKKYGVAIQRQNIERYGAGCGWRVETFYIDEAQSGVKERRSALQRLLRACRAGAVSAVVIASLDRLSRSLLFAEKLFGEFERLGVSVCIANMPHYDGTDDHDVMMRQITEVLAEYDRKRIIRRLKQGREARARTGKMSGGNLAYGYARDPQQPRRIVIHAAEAAIVRAIFSLRQEGRSTQGIADALNARGHRRRNGTPWMQRQVARVLARRALYRDGVVTYGEGVGKNPALILLREDV